MKKISIILLFFIGIASSAQAQIPPTNIYGKEVIVTTRDSSSAELTIKNSTRNVTNGILTNIGSGKTQFIALPAYTLLSRFLDSLTEIQIRIQSKQPLIAYTPIAPGDTAAMLANRLKISDTATMLNGYARSGNVVKYTDVGANNGVAALDAGGKVPFSQLPASLYIYKGTWDASTNTPTLANGSGTSGWVYQASVGGTVNFGAGAITFAAGDYVGYNGSIWQWSPGTNAVRSVNGQQGVVSLTTANIPEGGTDYYWTAARSRAAQSVSVTGLTYNNTTGDLSLTAGYVIPTTTEQSNWNTAYGWGNWAAGSHYIGTTLIANNRASASQSLTGVSIDGTAGNATTWNAQIYDPLKTGDLLDGIMLRSVNDGKWFRGTLNDLIGTATSLNIGGTAGSETLATVTGRGATTTANVTVGSLASNAGISAATGIGIQRNGSGTVGSGPYNYMYNAAGTDGMLWQLNAGNGIDFWGLTSNSFIGSPVATLSRNGNFAAQAISGTTADFSGTGKFGGGTGQSLASGSIDVLKDIGMIATQGIVSSGTRVLSFQDTYSVKVNGTFGVTGLATFLNDLTTTADLRGLYFAGTRNAILGSNSADEVYITAANATKITVGATSTTFSEKINVTTTNSSQWRLAVGAGNGDGIRLYNGTSSSGGTWDIYTDGTYGSFMRLYATDGTTANITLRGDGQGTFASTVSATLYKVSGTDFAAISSGYSIIYKPDGSYGVLLGTTTPINYYDNATHVFRGAAGVGTALTMTTTTAVFGGSVTATAIYETPSDIRKKTVTRRWKSADGIDQIEYFLKNDPDRKILYGYEAQQVMRVIPSAVMISKDASMPDGVSYSVGYTQVSIYKLAQLEKRITQLEKQLRR